MEEGVGAGPILDRAHLQNPALLGIQRPFAEGVVKDIRRHGAGKDHRPPLEVAVGRLLLRATQTDIAVLGKGDVKGNDQKSHADEDVKGAELVAQEPPDGVHDAGALPRGQDKEDAQPGDHKEGHQHIGGVQLPQQGADRGVVLILFHPVLPPLGTDRNGVPVKPMPPRRRRERHPATGRPRIRRTAWRTGTAASRRRRT